MTSLPLNFVLFLICGLVVNDASASGPVKGGHVSRGANRSMVLVSQPREHPKNNRTSIGRAGDSKGGQASPFVSSRKRGSRGRNPIERVSPPVRVFGYFLHEQKVTQGTGVKPPKPPGSGGGAPARF